MNHLQVFQNNKFGEIRVATTEAGDPIFCLVDLCSILDIKNVSHCKSRLNTKGVVTADTLTPGGTQKMTFVNEPNLYKVIFQSRKPGCEKIRLWGGYYPPHSR